jgi:hypothetical protein
MRKRPDWSTVALRPEGEDFAERSTAPMKPPKGTRSSLTKIVLPAPTSIAPPINGTKTGCQVTTKFGERGKLVNVAGIKFSERVARPSAKLTQAKTLLSF